MVRSISVQRPFNSRLTSVFLKWLGVKRTVHRSFFGALPYKYTCNKKVWFRLNEYCKTLNISVPLMLAKLAMRYHSLTFVVAKINVYCYTCVVVCHVVSKVGNGVLPVQLVAGKQLSLLLPSCDNPCTSTSAENWSVEQVREKERRKCGKYNHYDAEVRAKIAKHACEYGNKSAL